VVGWLSGVAFALAAFVAGFVAGFVAAYAFASALSGCHLSGAKVVENEPSTAAAPGCLLGRKENSGYSQKKRAIYVNLNKTRG